MGCVEGPFLRSVVISLTSVSFLTFFVIFILDDFLDGWIDLRE